MSKKEEKDRLADLLGEIDDKFIRDAAISDEEYAKLKEQRGSTPVVMNTKKEAGDAKPAPFLVDTNSDGFEIEPATRSKKSNKTATIIRIAASMSLVAAAAILFIFLWNPDRGVSPAASSEVASTSLTGNDIRSTEATPTEVASSEVAQVEPDTKQEVTEAPTQSPFTGKVITFGKYEQDDDETNGPEDINWLVLEEKNGMYLVISEQILEFRTYDDGTHQTWADSTLRKWLTEDFVAKAFSEEERAKIVPMKLTTSTPSYFDIENVTDSVETVFLLSYGEMMQYQVAETHCTFYAVSSPERNDLPYSWVMDAFDPSMMHWWVRTNGGNQGEVVRGYGMVPTNVSGNTVTNIGTNDRGGIRPAMWIDITGKTLEERSKLGDTKAEPETVVEHRPEDDLKPGETMPEIPEIQPRPENPDEEPVTVEEPKPGVEEPEVGGPEPILEEEPYGLEITDEPVVIGTEAP